MQCSAEEAAERAVECDSRRSMTQARRRRGRRTRGGGDAQGVRGGGARGWEEEAPLGLSI